MLSVIVPVLNEEQSLPAFLDTVGMWPDGCEVVFVDGGSSDRTLQLLEGRAVIAGARGRGAQCRLGASVTQGENLAFVHADSYVSTASMNAILNALEQGVRWGCLTLRFDGAGLALTFGAWMSNVRVRVSGVPFGDQVMFMTREIYDLVGGMPDYRLMEDYELSRRLAAVAKPRQLREKVVTSPRRFKSGGVVRTMLGMRRLRHLYRAGVPPEELADLYGAGR